MNNQKKGALMRMAQQFENVAYRTNPSTSDTIQIPFVSFGLARDPQREEDTSINASPLPAIMGCGDAVVPPAQIVVPFDLRTIGVALKGLLGQPTAYKAVTTQPVNVTGVTIFYAGPSAASGAGTLTYTTAGTTLTWTPQAGTAGAAVNVGAGGRFRLEGGGGADRYIDIHVEAGALPVGNASDATINVHATMKTHSFPCDMSDPASLLTELAHLDPAANEFYRYMGFVYTQGQFPIADGEQNVTLTAFAAQELSADTTPAVTAAWDTTPTAYDPARACKSFGLISNGLNSALGTIVTGNFNINNQAAGEVIAEGSEGYGHVDVNEKLLTGQITALFTGLTANSAYAKARSQSTTRLRVQSRKTVGADVFAFTVDMPSVELMEAAPAREGKTGLKVTMNYRAIRNTAGTLPMILLTNDITAF